MRKNTAVTVRTKCSGPTNLVLRWHNNIVIILQTHEDENTN